MSWLILSVCVCLSCSTYWYLLWWFYFLSFASSFICLFIECSLLFSTSSSFIFVICVSGVRITDSRYRGGVKCFICAHCLLPRLLSRIWCAGYVDLAYFLIWHVLYYYPWYGWPVERKKEKEERWSISFVSREKRQFQSVGRSAVWKCTNLCGSCDVIGFDESAVFVCFLLRWDWTKVVRMFGLVGRVSPSGDQASEQEKRTPTQLTQTRTVRSVEANGGKRNLFATRKHLRIHASFLCIK